MSKSTSLWLVLAVFLLYGCTTNEKTKEPGYERIIKDDSFRARIKIGNFIRLSAGHTYYEFENWDKDTIIVFVHGFSVPSYIWDSTYHAALKRGYGALRYDTFGRGYSDNPDMVYDVSLFNQQLTELLDSLHITVPINLVGLSDGGRTISVFAAHHPERIANLIYVDPTGFETITTEAGTPASVTVEEIQTFMQSERYANMASGQLSDFYDSVPFRGWDTKYEELMRYKGFVRALLSTGKNRTNLEEAHRSIATSGIPVFAIWGEHDTVVKLEDVRDNLLERIPGVKLHVIPKAGHLPHMEQTVMFNSILFEQIVCCRNK